MISKYNISPRAIKNAQEQNWDLTKMFNILKRISIPTRIKNTWYQILHNSISVMSNIHSENHTSTCQLCNQEEEDIPHLLSKCNKTKFLQIPNWSIWPTEEIQLANLLTTHYLIWKTRCEAILGDKPIIKPIALENLKLMKEFNHSLILFRNTKSSNF